MTIQQIIIFTKQGMIIKITFYTLQVRFFFLLHEIASLFKKTKLRSRITKSFLRSTEVYLLWEKKNIFTQFLYFPTTLSPASHLYLHHTCSTSVIASLGHTVSFFLSFALGVKRVHRNNMRRRARERDRLADTYLYTHIHARALAPVAIVILCRSHSLEREFARAPVYQAHVLECPRRAREPAPN